MSFCDLAQTEVATGNMAFPAYFQSTHAELSSSVPYLFLVKAVKT